MMGAPARGQLQKGLYDLGNIAGLVGDRSKIDAVIAEIQEACDAANTAEANARQALADLQNERRGFGQEKAETVAQLQERETAVTGREKDVTDKGADLLVREQTLAKAMEAFEQDMAAREQALKDAQAAHTEAQAKLDQDRLDFEHSADAAEDRIKKDREAADLEIRNAHAALDKRALKLTADEQLARETKEAADAVKAEYEAKFAELQQFLSRKSAGA